MSWSRRSAAVVLVTLVVGTGLAACGFKPMYGTQGAVSAETLGDVWVAPIANRSGQLVHEHLTRGLNPTNRNGGQRYRLDVALRETRSELGIRKDQTATRANLTLHARFVMVDLVADKVVYEADSSVTTSYNIVEAQFATVAAELDSLERAARAMADNIRSRVAAYFARKGKVAAQ